MNYRLPFIRLTNQRLTDTLPLVGSVEIQLCPSIWHPVGTCPYFNWLISPSRFRFLSSENHAHQNEWQQFLLSLPCRKWLNDWVDTPRHVMLPPLFTSFFFTSNYTRTVNPSLITVTGKIWVACSWNENFMQSGFIITHKLHALQISRVRRNSNPRFQSLLFSILFNHPNTQLGMEER